MSAASVGRRRGKGALAIVAVAGALLGCQKKAPPPTGRPADVCGGLKNLPDCSTQQGDAASNCYMVGSQQYNCGLFEDAAASYQKSVSLHPEARSWHALGDALFIQEKWQEAKAAYSKAVALDPTKRASWIRLGESEHHLKEYDAAHDALSRAEALGPAIDAVRADAEVLADALKLDEAVAALQKAEGPDAGADLIALVTQETQILRLGIRKATRDHDDEALARRSIALASTMEHLNHLEPGKVATLRDVADAELAAGELTRAEDAFRQVMKADSKDFISSRMVALLEEKRGEIDGGMADVHASLSVQPRQAMGHLILSRLAFESKDAPTARKEFASALSLSNAKDLAEVRQLAQLAEQVGLLQNAEDLFGTLVLDADQAALLDNWLESARISQKLGHAAQVKADCDKARALVSNAVCPPSDR